MKILVVDVGRTHIKYASTDHPSQGEFASGRQLTAADMVNQFLKLTRTWRYDAVSIGYPGVVAGGRPVRDPQNLGQGWVGFDFAAAFGRPVRIRRLIQCTMSAGPRRRRSRAAIVRLGRLGYPLRPLWGS